MYSRFRIISPQNCTKQNLLRYHYSTGLPSSSISSFLRSILYRLNPQYPNMLSIFLKCLVWYSSLSFTHSPSPLLFHGKHPSAALSDSAHIKLYSTPLIENKTEKLGHSTRSLCDYSWDVDSGYANYIAVTDITAEHSGFLFDDTIRIRVKLNYEYV